MSHFYLTLYLLVFLTVLGFFSVGLAADFSVDVAFLAGVFAVFLVGAGSARAGAGFSALGFPSDAGFAVFSMTGFGSAFSTLRSSPGLPMKSTLRRVYC